MPIVASIIILTILAPLAPARSDENPDFTRGQTIPEGARHDWTLGPTGMRGWMHAHKLETTQARQIYVTQVDSESPAEGLFQVGDVVLGVNGKPFSYDPRTELGKAIAEARTKAMSGSTA